MSLIAIRNISKVYGKDGVETVALRDVSFSIATGEFVAIMGPSGSGKSTLLQILGLLDEPSSGEYKFRDKSIAAYTAEELARLRNTAMGFVFQSFHLLPRTTVLENVKLPLLYSALPEREWDERANNALSAVGLSHRLRHEPSQLSGGERQRVAIARALVQSPEVIFADEPTGNLDSASGRLVMEILERLNQTGGHTVILITHETDTAAHARRIIRLHDGQLVADELVKNHRAGTEFVK